MATDDKSKANNLIVGGYEFETEIDAQKATLDLQKIKVLNSRAKVSSPKEIKAVYEKAIENKIFRTPIGWEYLNGLRTKLLENGYTEEDLIPIPLGITVTRHSAIENLNVQQRIKPEKEKEPAEFKRVFPIVLNIMLIILVIIMFVIAATSESDNIINYRRNVTNRFASWEEDLKEREKKVREAEKRLGIEDTSSYYEDTDAD
jgi:hypothetical protein